MIRVTAEIYAMGGDICQIHNSQLMSYSACNFVEFKKNIYLS